MIIRIILTCIMLLTIALPVSAEDVLYNAGLAGIWGVVIRENSDVEAIVQPFRPGVSGWASRIGIAIASGADPNGAGFRFTLTDTSLGVDIPGAEIAGSRSIMPVSGAALSYAYVTIPPVFLSKDKIYGMRIEPGDSAMYGSVAYTYPGPLARATRDDWATSFNLPYTTAVRVYGTAVVPEPASIFTLFACIAAIGAAARRKIF